MDALRCVKVSVTMTASTADQLDAYRRERRWTRSTAAAVLIEQGLAAASRSAARKQQPDTGQVAAECVQLAAA